MLNISKQKRIRYGLFELDDNDDAMPIDGKATQFDIDSNGDVMPETDIETEYDDDEFELDGNGDVMPSE